MTTKNKAVFGVYESSVQAEKAVGGISVAGFCETSEEGASAKDLFRGTGLRRFRLPENRQRFRMTIDAANESSTARDTSSHTKAGTPPPTVIETETNFRIGLPITDAGYEPTHQEMRNSLTSEGTSEDDWSRAKNELMAKSKSA